MSTTELRVQSTLEGRFRRHRILVGDRVLACFNPAADTSASYLLRRPSLHPLYTPAGLPVTEQGAHNFPHHKGVFLALGLVNETDVYSDVMDTTGRLTTREVTFRHDHGTLVMDTVIDWVDQAGSVLIEERRIHRFSCGESAGRRANRVDVDSRLSTPVTDGVHLPQDKHGYFHARVIDAIDEEDGGTVTASNGRTGADACFGTDGYWIDTRGHLGPNPVGIAIMVHPRFGPQPLFARTYGTIALNPFARVGRFLAHGETYRNLYSVWAYDWAKEFDVSQAFDEFVETASDE